MPTDRTTCRARIAEDDDVAAQKPSITLFSWNVAKRRAHMDQVAAIAHVASDVVALQEVSYLRSDKFAKALRELGYVDVQYSRDAARAPSLKHGVLVASSWPLLSRTQPDVPFPESALSVEISSPYGPIEMTTVHVPNGSTYGVKKVETLEAVYEHCARSAAVLQLLCGDFNTPYREDPDGRVITFGQRVAKDGSVTMKSDDGRWDRAERGILLGLAEHGMHDAFRTLHSYGLRASSWREYRLDHVFASAQLRAVACRYLDELRTEGLSDHSALLAEFELSEPRVSD